MERWVDIKGHDGYEISNLGHVRNKKTGRILKPHQNNGHERVRVGDKLFYTGRLREEAFPTIGESVSNHHWVDVVLCGECLRRYEYDWCEDKDDDFYCPYGRK